MKIDTFRSFRTGCVLIATMLAAFPMHGLEAATFDLGNASPGLHIIFHSTNEYVIYLDKHYMVYLPKAPGSRASAGDWRKDIQIVADRNIGLRQRLSSDFWREGEQQLYPFGDQRAFTCRGTALPSTPTERLEPRTSQVFSLTEGGIVECEDVDALARARYGLTTNQIFLGKVGTNVYFFDPSNPRRVYYRGVGERAVSSYFMLPKGVVDVFGATMASSTNRAVGFWGLRKRRTLQSPVDDFFIEMSFSDSRRLGK